MKKETIKKFIEPTNEKITFSKILALIGIILAFLPVAISENQELILVYLSMIFLWPAYLIDYHPSESLFRMIFIFITFIILLFYWYLLACVITLFCGKSKKGEE